MNIGELLGGPGKCEYCEELFQNLSYHQSKCEVRKIFKEFPDDDMQWTKEQWEIYERNWEKAGNYIRKLVENKKENCG